MRLLLLYTLFGLLAAAARAQEVRQQTSDEGLVSATVPAISFFWQLGNSDVQQRGMQRCSRPLSLATDNPQSPAVTVPPLYLTLFPIGLQPSTQLALESGNLTFFDWTPNLPVGTNFSVGMTDSASPPNSGGVVDGFYVTEGFDNCTDATTPGSAISLAIDPSDTACEEIDLDIKGGQEPYTISVLAGLSGLYGNLTGVVTEKVKLRNTVPPGQTFNIFVTDVNGLTSNVSSTMTSALGSPFCNLPTEDDTSNSSTPLGAIIGGAVGGVVGALLLALLAWWLLRRRSEKANQRYRDQELATKGEFRMADGTVPLVQPFVVPQRSSEYDGSSPTSLHSPHDYPYSGAHTTPPPPLHHSGYSNSNSQSPNSPISPSSHHTYPSYGEGTHSYEPTAASSTVDGLANPEEFAYRDGGTWTSTGNTPSMRSLPPGAQPPMER